MLRTEEELLGEMMRELGFHRRGKNVFAALRPAIVRTTLRTCAPLVGAGLGRIAYLADRVLPLTLAARAETRLALAGPKGTAQITDLLEQEALAA